MAALQAEMQTDKPTPDKAKKKRKARFSDEERSVLVQEYSKYKDLLVNKFSDTVTLSKKHKAWDKICNAVNSCNPSVVRTVADVKKKWQDIKSSTKAKEAVRRKEMKKTGGGKMSWEPLDDTEQFAVGVIGDTAIEGVDEGIDTFVQTQLKSVSTATATSTAAASDDIQARAVDGDHASPDSPVAGTSNATPPQPPRKDLKIPKDRNPDEDIIKIERQKLEMERQRLDVEKQRLEIEKRRFEVEEQKLKLKKLKMAIVYPDYAEYLKDLSGDVVVHYRPEEPTTNCQGEEGLPNIIVHNGEQYMNL